MEKAEHIFPVAVRPWVNLDDIYPILLHGSHDIVNRIFVIIKPLVKDIPRPTTTQKPLSSHCPINAQQECPGTTIRLPYVLHAVLERLPAIYSPRKSID